MISFDDLTDLPPWIKTGATLLLGAGAAKLLGVWLENRRLAKKEYRDTLLQRIRDLETMIAGMHVTHVEMAVKVARLEDDLEECKRLHAQRGGPPKKA
jgi:hypothetical protein